MTPLLSPPVRNEAAALLRLAGPLIAGQIATIGMSFVDTVMAGQLSPLALASVALGGAVWQTLLLFLIGTLTAISPSVAQLVGAGRFRPVATLVRQGGWIGLGLSVIIAGIMRSADPIFSLLRVEPEIVPTALGYLEALAWGVPGVAIYLVLRYLSEGLGHTWPVMWIGALGLGVNVLANWVLMYGQWGFPALGAVGCGYATALVFWVQALAMALWVRFGGRFREVTPFRRFEPPRRRPIGELLELGIPIGIMIFLEASLFAGVSLLMGRLGTVAVAGHQVAINFVSITFMVPLGVAMAITVRVGQAAGRGDRAGVRRAGWTGIGLALVAQACTAVILLTLPRWIARIYTQDTAVIQMAASLLMMAAIFQFSDGTQVAAAGALRGIKDTRVPMWITLATYWGLGLPAAWWIGIRLGYGPPGLWSAWIVALTVAAVLLAWRFYRLSGSGRSTPASLP